MKHRKKSFQSPVYFVQMLIHTSLFGNQVALTTKTHLTKKIGFDRDNSIIIASYCLQQNRSQYIWRTTLHV